MTVLLTRDAQAVPVECTVQTARAMRLRLQSSRLFPSSQSNTMPGTSYIYIHWVVSSHCLKASVRTEASYRAQATHNTGSLKQAQGVSKVSKVAKLPSSKVLKSCRNGTTQSKTLTLTRLQRQAPPSILSTSAPFSLMIAIIRLFCTVHLA